MVLGVAITDVAAYAVIAGVVGAALLAIASKFGFLQSARVEATDNVYKEEAAAWKERAERQAGEIKELHDHVDRMVALVEGLRKKVDEQETVIAELRARPDYTTLLGAIAALQEHILERFTGLEKTLAKK